MSQLNINLTSAFERDLQKLMKLRQINTKAEAIRYAVKESVARATHAKTADFNTWLGMAKQAPENKRAKFKSDDDLWS